MGSNFSNSCHTHHNTLAPKYFIETYRLIRYFMSLCVVHLVRGVGWQTKNKKIIPYAAHIDTCIDHQGQNSFISKQNGGQHLINETRMSIGNKLHHPFCSIMFVCPSVSPLGWMMAAFDVFKLERSFECRFYGFGTSMFDITGIGLASELCGAVR
ncbi:hypothetical protein JTE90_006984 [Oedothorax gibbosus]|uniref:Uncharacterized protein n=1 Tax=Oedothorax gibbosus TaxID=931172 RepID=A0AAV6VBA3_9ARAC|nr:hypothetical protein JTE90_006984 [Oedothorax gibbosus]